MIPETISATEIIRSLATAGGASQLTRLGSEGLAAQVDALKTAGVPKSEMVVLSEEDAAVALGSPLPADYVAQLVAAVKAEMTRDPTGTDPLVSKPPTWLPERGR